MSRASDFSVWNKLHKHVETTKGITLAALFEKDPARRDRLTFQLDGLEADFSHTHLTEETLNLFLALAEEQQLKAWQEKMFQGKKINISEDRAVLHTALRAQTDDPVCVDDQNVIPAIRELHKKMELFVRNVREGNWLGATGQPIRNIVNIGIGGSDLGPRLVVSAFRSQATGPQIHFVANVDAADLTATLSSIDPATSLFVIVSKTFTTQETLLNARSARQWLVGSLGEDAVSRHFVAVSAHPSAVQSFGIDPSNMFEMWDWVGGRYSLWSAVGLSIALSLGWENFQGLLAGASAVDTHFRTTPLEKNIPFLMAATGLLYRNFRQAPALAVLPYSERLRELPRFLQQLDMESNGKRVTRENKPVDYETGPIIFGDCGSISQHSFHQWLHQSPSTIPADFIGIRQDDLAQGEHHHVLIAHMKAQVEALAAGRKTEDLARDNPGNKPSTVFWLERLSPYHLGLLLALYEHKVFCQGVLWGINSFDQFGVELGKALAKTLLEKEAIT